MSWLDDLEARLESQLEDFLRSNPSQEQLLAEQERRDRLEALRSRRLQLQEQAEGSRSGLLRLAEEIRAWQERVLRARRAGAHELAARAEAHGAALMEQGRQRWQDLAELGQRLSALEWELSQLERQAAGKQPSANRTAPAGEATAGRSQGGSASGPTAAGGGSAAGGENDLQDAWAAFEAQQELEELRDRLRR